MTTEPLLAVFGRTPPLPPMAQPNVDLKMPKFQPPASWRKSANDQFSLAAFSAGPEDRAARFTVTRMSAVMDVETQLNRWRSQVGLSPLAPEEWSQQAEVVDIGGVDASFAHLKGESESIAGAVLQLDGTMWFFKMRGPNDTVAEELARMKELCQEATFDVSPQRKSEAGKKEGFIP